jgi:glycosyltransferase involved in cell wall biosynthesis
MRILHVSSAVNYGGGERHLVDLSREMQTRGHAVFMALRPTNRWQNRLDFIPADNILHVSIRNSFGVFSAKRIADFIRDNDINIVHAHVARDYIPASIACIAARNAKFVLTRHVIFPLKPFNRFALKNLSRAIAVSSAVETSLRGIFQPDKVALIPNGLAFNDFSHDHSAALAREFREFHDIPLDAPLIGTVGELTELKGQLDFVLAANEIVKRHPKARFLIVGKDNSLDQKFRRELKRLVSVFGLEARFLWLDWIEDLSPVLSAIDIYVSPSHSESFGLATLEAMAWAKPVVATATEGSKELLPSDDLLVPIRDPVALAEAISGLLDSRDRADQIGAELRDRAVENFSLSSMVDATEKLYQEILSGSR